MSGAGLDKVRPAAQAVIQKLRALHDAPDEIEVEFGLKLSAEAGAVIAAGGVEANCKVTLNWMNVLFGLQTEAYGGL